MHFHHIRSIRPAAAIVCLAAALACNRGNGAAPQGGGAPPPMKVSSVVLAPKPIDDASEFIATVRSLRSSTVQPEVDGVHGFRP